MKYSSSLLTNFINISPFENMKSKKKNLFPRLYFYFYGKNMKPDRSGGSVHRI